jgi:hypothetical protein
MLEACWPFLTRCRHSCAYGQSVPAELKGLGMTPKQVVKTWVERLNTRDATALAEFYYGDAINHQVTQEPVEGREAIRAMFEPEFATTEMVCIIE